MYIALDHKIWDGRWGVLLTVLAGMSLPLAFAPYDLIFLVLVSPAIYVLSFLHCAPKKAFWRGYVYGLASFGVGISWVSVSMIRFGHMSLALSVFLTILFVAFWSLMPALVAWLSQRVFAKTAMSFKLLLIIPSAWTFTEWFRSWLFTGYPWLSLGYTQVEGPLYGYAPVLGVYGLSWFILVLVGCCLLLLQSREQSQRYRLLALFTGILCASLVLGQVEWTRETGKTIKSSLIQGNIPQQLKWDPKYRQVSVQLYTDLSRQNWDSDLIIWPETAFPAYYHRAKSYLMRLGEEAKRNNTDLLIGIPMVDENNSSLHYNSMISLGSNHDYYHKRHLVPFGEYLPLKSLLGDLLLFFKVPMANFSSGNSDRMILEVAGAKAGISICYEDAFGVEVIQALPEADLLVNVSNDAWFGDSFAPHQHLQMAQLRSLETGRPMLRATNNGVSAIIDHMGNIQKQSPQFEQAVLKGTVKPRNGSTPYAKFGNWPVILLFSSILLLGFVQVYRNRGGDKA